jgi:cytochrome c-type biogenesis protein CcmH/NrfG
MMPRALTRGVFAAVGIGLVGVLVGALLSYWLTLRFSQTEALAAVIKAEKSESAGKENEAIILLSQAIAEDPDYYEPFNLLGDILARRNDRDLALSMYGSALEALDRESASTARRADIGRVSAQVARDSIRKKMKDLQDQHSQHANP